jgi:recombination protein RecR
LINRHETNLSPVVTQLIDELSKLPGIGPKTAQRLTYFLIRMPENNALSLSEAIKAIKEKIKFCSVCHNITEQEICELCSNPSRDQSRICVVEEPLDVLALERTRSFNGVYHVIHGVISPLNGIGPEDLKIPSLIKRVTEKSVEELILAMNPNLEGEATSMYIHNLTSDSVSKITRPARGLPAGGDLEYADELTLSRALEGRQEF